MFLGVDGGGTKTAWCLLDGGGGLRASLRTRSCSYFSGKVSLVTDVLAEGVALVCETAAITPADIGFAFFGLPGYGEASADLPSLDAAPRAALGHTRYRCGNDMICGWAGSLGGADGINVVSGTGSIAYGERRGIGVRAGGWGELFGDEGSGYWVAVRGMGVYGRMKDGRQAPGPLVGILDRELGLSGEFDLVDLVLNRWKGARAEIAAASRAVVTAADAGDAAASAILREAGGELALLVTAVRARLGYESGERTAVSYSGGMFGVPQVRASFAATLAAHGPEHALVEPLLAPEVGSALHAAKLAGTPLAIPTQLRLQNEQ